MRQIFIFIFILLFFAAQAYGKATTYPEGKTDSYIEVQIYDTEKACNGTTLLTDRYKKPRVIEVDMHGKVIWEYVLPFLLKVYTNPGFDAELLPNGNILIVLPKKGIIEIDSKTGEVVWGFPNFDRMNTPVRDADRLPNGNTIITGTRKIVEVTPDGEVVWDLRYKTFNIKSGLERARKGFFKAQRIPLPSP